VPRLSESPLSWLWLSSGAMNALQKSLALAD
jgi:hypothetical protein